MTTIPDSKAADSVADIPLNQLVTWDGNVRKTAVSDGIEELKASILAHGVLQSLVVRPTPHGEYAVVAGQRRLLALSALAAEGALEPDALVPCRIVPASADAAEVSLTENVVRAPMHPADQFDAFRDLVDAGASIADIAARFGIAEAAVRKRLKLARVSPLVFAAYREGTLTLDHMQAFAVTDDHAAQERVLGELSHWNDAADIRAALTENDIPATDRRARFVTLDAYEQAGGRVLRDLFAKGDDGVYLLDGPLLDQLAMQKLHATAEALRAEGWKWIEPLPELDYETQAQFRRRYPEPLPLSDEAMAERDRLVLEHDALCDSEGEFDEAASARLEAIEARIEELEDTGQTYPSEVLAIAGAIVTIGRSGEAEILRGLVRPEDEPARPRPAAEPRPELSPSLVESLTEARSAGISAALSRQPLLALAAVTHRMACMVFGFRGDESSLQLSAKATRFHEAPAGAIMLDAMHQEWLQRIPSDSLTLWNWCLAQDQGTVLELLAYCVSRSVDAVQRKADHPQNQRLVHAHALAMALNLDMAEWFAPTAANFFSRISRATILSSLAEATGAPAKRSWDKLKKRELAALAEREIAGKGWLPKPLRASA